MPPWDLAEQPVTWLHLAMDAEAVEARARHELQERNKWKGGKRR